MRPLATIATCREEFNIDFEVDVFAFFARGLGPLSDDLTLFELVRVLVKELGLFTQGLEISLFVDGTKCSKFDA